MSLRDQRQLSYAARGDAGVEGINHFPQLRSRTYRENLWDSCSQTCCLTWSMGLLHSFWGLLLASIRLENYKQVKNSLRTNLGPEKHKILGTTRAWTETGKENQDLPRYTPSSPSVQLSSTPTNNFICFSSLSSKPPWFCEERNYLEDSLNHS